MKPITMTNELIESILTNVRTSLGKMHTPDKTLNLSVPMTYAVAKDTPKPTVIVTINAYLKMYALVQQAKEEIAWHGVVERTGLTFTIKDILVFPQEVTESTATATDDYGLWINELDDATFDSLRFHGHSHVNMGVTPSGVDTTYQEQLIDQVQDYYIFAIYNKRDDFNIWIYDKTTNTMYDKADITYTNMCTECYDWAAAQITTHVRKHVYTQPANASAFAKDVKVDDKDVTEVEGRSWYMDGYGKVRSKKTGLLLNESDILLLSKKDQKAIEAKRNSIIYHAGDGAIGGNGYSGYNTMTLAEYQQRYERY